MPAAVRTKATADEYLVPRTRSSCSVERSPLARSHEALDVATYDVAESAARAPFWTWVAISTGVTAAGPRMIPTTKRSRVRCMTPVPRSRATVDP